jgi:hypothetical protein
MFPYQDKAKGWLVVVALATFFVPGQAAAQKKFPINSTSDGIESRYVQQHVIDVGDVKGHQVRILEIHRVYSTRQIKVDGVDVVEEWSRGFSDYTNGVGPARGYGIWVLDDGNKVFLEWHGSAYTVATATGSRRGTFNGTTKIYGGTGKYAKIRGMMADTVEFDTDPKTGYNRGSTKGEYWFDD